MSMFRSIVCVKAVPDPESPSSAFEIDPVASYRAYYQSKQQSFSMTWKTREVPSWFKVNK